MNVWGVEGRDFLLPRVAEIRRSCVWKDRVLKAASKGQQWDHGSLGIELRLGDTRGFL